MFLVCGEGGANFLEKKRYKGVRFNVISITRWWVGVKPPEKKHCEHWNGFLRTNVFVIENLQARNRARHEGCVGHESGSIR